MGFYSYSPWADAARFGQGVGDTLGQAILARPQARFEMARQLAMDKMAQARFDTQQEQAPLQTQLLQSRIENENSLSSDRARQMDLRGRMLDLQDQGLGIRQQIADARAANLNAHTTQVGVPKPATQSEQIRNFDFMQKNGVPTLLSRAQTPLDEKGQPTIPIDAGDAVNYGASLMDKGASPQDVLSQLQAVPNTTTDTVGWPWNRHPQVTTNSMTIQHVSQLPPPEARPKGLRTITAKGTFEWNGMGWQPVTQ